MPSMASTSGATNATTTTTSRRIATRGTRTSAAASSTAAAVSRDSSSSTRAKKRRSIQQQRPTTRSCRRRKLSSTSTCSSNSEMIDPDKNDRESDNNNNSSEMTAVESIEIQRQEKQPLDQSSSMKTDVSGTENFNPSAHCKEGGDTHQIIPVRVRRKRKLQTEQQHENTNNADSLRDNRMCRIEMKHTTTQNDDQRIRFDNNDGAEDGKKATLESKSVTESPISTIHNAKLEETSIGLIKTASFLIEDNDDVNINGIDKTLTSETQKEQKNEEMLIFDRLDMAQDENDDKKVNCTTESQSIVARSIEESSSSPITDDQLIKNSTIRHQQQESVYHCESSDEQGTISSLKIEDKVANEQDCCINNNMLVDDETKKKSRSPDHDNVRSIDAEHHSGEHSNLNVSTDQSYHLQKKALNRTRNVTSSPCELQNAHLCGGKSELDDDNEGTQDSSKSSKDTFLTPENNMEPILDDFAFQLSDRTITTTTQPCDTSTSISKINGYRFGRIRQTASPFGNENITATDRCHQSLTLEVSNAKTHAESCEISGNLLQTAESPVDTCPKAKNININNAFGTTDGVVSMTPTFHRQKRTVLPNGEFDLVDSIKVAIHAEASKVHRGKGANRIFTEYLERLGMYLSSTSSSRARPHFSSNCSTKFSTNVDHDSSIEAFFINFLKSKKLRNMHNKLIMVLMKYSMEAQVPLEKFCSQIPHQWLKSVSEARSPDELIVSDEPVANIEVDRQRAQLVDQIRYLKSSFSAESGVWAKCDTSNILYPPPLFSVDTETPYPSKRDDRSLLPSGTVPGALAIDPLVRNITKREGVSVDEYALWLIIIATRQLTSEILQLVVTEITRSRSMSNGVVSESNNDASKHVKISTLDVAQILTKSPIYGSKCSSHRSLSRGFMDRLLNAAGRGMLPCPPEAPIGVQQAIVHLIHEASSNRSKILTAHACQALETESSDTSKAKTDDSSAMVYRKGRGVIDLSYPSPPNATQIVIGQLEYASTSQQPLLPASLTAPCAKSEVSKQVLENAEIPTAEEDNHEGKTSPPPVSSSLSRRRVGAKDLAALRARRIASAQQEQKIDDSVHATVSTADTAMAENQGDALLSAKDSES